MDPHLRGLYRKSLEGCSHWGCQLEYPLGLPKHSGLSVVIFTMCMKYLKGTQLPVNEGNSIFPEGFDTEIILLTPRVMLLASS